jgi:hypothetical protein
MNKLRKTRESNKFQQDKPYILRLEYYAPFTTKEAQGFYQYILLGNFHHQPENLPSTFCFASLRNPRIISDISKKQSIPDTISGS